MTRKSFLIFLAPGFLATAWLYAVDWETISVSVGESIIGHMALALLMVFAMSMILWPILILFFYGAPILNRFVAPIYKSASGFIGIGMKRAQVAYRTESYTVLRKTVMAEGLGDKFASLNQDGNSLFDRAVRRFRQGYRSQHRRFLLGLLGAVFLESPRASQPCSAWRLTTR